MATQQQQQQLGRNEGPPEDIVRGDIVGSGRWEILDDGTQGGMATVFRARDTRTKGEVALKVIARRYVGRFDREKRFQNEGRLAARLKGHRNIAAPIETGVLADRGNRMFLAMELVRGPTLLDFISMNGPLRVDKTLLCIRDVARALRDLHASEVVHRDVTSNNLILVETGHDQHTAVLIDFGLATEFGSVVAPGAERLTRAGEIPGTPHYMSPEQAWGEQAHPAFDIYALGVVFYEMLVGEPVWHELDAVQVKARKCDLAKLPPPVIERRRDVPAGVSELIGWCLSPQKKDRPSATTFLAELDEIRESLGIVDQRETDSTGVVEVPRTIDQPKREPKLKAMIAEAQAAKEARQLADLQQRPTRPVVAVPEGEGPRGLTEPAPAADSARGRAHKATDVSEEAGAVAPRISGKTEAADAVRPRNSDKTEIAPAAEAKPGRMALVGLLLGAVVAIPVLLYVLRDGGSTEATQDEGVGVAAMAGHDVAAANGSGSAKAGETTPPPPADEGGPAVADSTPEPVADGPQIPDADGGNPKADDGNDTAVIPPSPADGGTPPPDDDGVDDTAITDDDGGQAPPSADGGDPGPGTKPKSIWTEERCAAERDQAMKDRLAGKFASVLTHTRIRKCWPNGRERLELRVRALSELGRFQECVDTGASSSDEGIARMVRRCRKKLEG